MITSYILLTGAISDGVGEKVKGNSYYKNSSNILTVLTDMTTVDATVKIEATLVSNPDDNDWFDITPSIMLDGISTETVHGNFVWVRASVENYVSGIINSIAIQY